MHVSKYTYPVGTHLDRIWFSILVLPEWYMPCSAADGVSVFNNGKMMYRGIGQSLL